MGAPSLAYRRAGCGRPLVLVHGYLGGAAMWQEQIDFFAGDFDVIAPDLPGFGDSSHLEAPDSLVGQAEQVLDFLTDLGIGDFHLLGHSMGGMIAQQLAATATERVTKLVLYGTGPTGIMPDRFEPVAESLRRLEQDGPLANAARIAATWFVAGSAGRGYGLCQELGVKVSARTARTSLSACGQWDFTSQLANLALPTLVLWGDRDRSYRWPQAEALWRGIPDCALAVVPGCAHNVHLEKPDLFNRLVADFLV